MKKINIIICEDDHLFLLDLEDKLLKLGHSVIGKFLSGEDLLSKISSLPADLIIMDIQLEGMLSGTETAEVILTKFNIPSIFITALQDEKTIENAHKSTPLGFIVKPINDNELKMTIEFGYSRHNLEKKMVNKLQEYKEFLDKIGYANQETTQLSYPFTNTIPNISSISKVLGKLANNINESLEIIHTNLNWLSDCKTIEKFEERHIDAALNGYKQIYEIIEQLLWISQISSKTYMHSHLFELITTAVTRIQNSLTKEILISITNDIEADDIFVDSEAIILAISNILLNAIEAISDKGKISIILNQNNQITPERYNPKSEPGMYYVIKITDNGCGFSNEIAERIFEPFFTPNKTLKNGLGLSAAFGIMQTHGGWITVDTEKGKGSTFELYLPHQQKIAPV